MQSFFKNNVCNFRQIRNEYYNTSIKHIPFVPVFIETDITTLTQNEKDIYMMKQKRRDIYRISVNSWLDNALFDNDGFVFELPSDKEEFLNDALDRYKIHYMIIHNETLGNKHLDQEYFTDRNNVGDYEKKYDMEFIITNNHLNSGDQENDVSEGNRGNSNKIFVSEQELINTLKYKDIEEYSVNVRDVLRTIYKEILELIFYNNFDIIDMSAFKDDFIHFMYILSDIDSLKLLKKSL
jgi:hypothetical protein